MPKILILDPNMNVEDAIQESAESVFDSAVSIVKKEGVCYMRFTREDGIQIIDPRYYKKINGVIADA